MGTLVVVAGCRDEKKKAPETEPAEIDACELLELPSLLFTQGGQGRMRREVASDFSLETLDGPWNPFFWARDDQIVARGPD